jgi:hypothetical protein
LTDIQAALETDVAGAPGITADAKSDPRMPFTVIKFAVIAFGAEALWLGLIGWWLLNLF